MTHRNAAHNFTWSAIGFLACMALLLIGKAVVWIGSLVGWL